MVYDNIFWDVTPVCWLMGTVLRRSVLPAYSGATVFFGALVSICQAGWHHDLMCVIEYIVKSLCHI